MREAPNVRQHPGESRRRWFYSDDFDLIVWFSAAQEINGFELCYDKRATERALVWNHRAGFRHLHVDDGEGRTGKHKSSPILTADGDFDARRVHAAFATASVALPAEIAGFVLDALTRHPNFGRPTPGKL